MFEQDRMIGRLQRRVAAAAEIAACFMSGSFGRRTNDEFSDLDIALVFNDDLTRDNAWRERQEFASSIMPYLAMKSFDAEHVRPYFHIALYANGSKLDCRYETKKSLMPNPWDSQIRILKDSDNWLEAYQTESAQLAYPRPSITGTELAELDDRFWIMYWDIVRQLARGDSYRPFTIYLQLLHFTLPKVLEVLPAGDPARNMLSQAQYEYKPQKSIASMANLLEGYLAARTSIIKQCSLQFTIDNAFESEIRRLLQRFD